MVVIENNRLSKDFLKASNLQNNRALIADLWPEDKLKARSNADLIDQIDVENKEVLPEVFREAMWRMAEVTGRGHYHVGISAMPGFRANNGIQKALDGCAQVSETYGSSQTIVTGRPLDARVEETERGPDVKILYLGEAETEVYTPDRDRIEEENGERYMLKAYRQMYVPVVSMIRLGAFNTFAWTITRAIHRSLTPTNEAAGLREYMQDLLQLPFPPYGGIAEGIRKLWEEDKIQAKLFKVVDVDGSHLTMGRGPGTLNQPAIDAERALRSWNMDSGNLKFKDVPFRVNTGKAIFSFGQRVTWDQAQGVLQAIMSAAP